MHVMSPKGLLALAVVTVGGTLLGLSPVGAGVSPVGCCQGFAVNQTQSSRIIGGGPTCFDIAVPIVARNGTDPCGGDLFVPGAACNQSTGICESPVGGCCSCAPNLQARGAFDICAEDPVDCLLFCGGPFIPGWVCTDGGCEPPPPPNGECTEPPSPCPPPDLSNAIYCEPGQRCNGTPGDDVICGTPGDDVINARGGDDVICADAGNDRIGAGQGDDWIDGDGPCAIVPFGALGPVAEFDDTINGRGGADVILGNVGDDTLNGNAGQDRIFGGPGENELSGGGQDDVLVGGGPDSSANGGKGDDTCEADFERNCELACPVFND